MRQHDLEAIEDRIQANTFTQDDGLHLLVEVCRLRWVIRANLQFLSGECVEGSREALITASRRMLGDEGAPPPPWPRRRD